jgi:hypothetical protein
MPCSFPRRATRALVVPALGAVLVGSAATSAFALCRLPLGTTPGACAYSGTGAGLTIDATGSGAPGAMAILGAASKGNGIKGTTSGAKAAGMFAEGTGTAGYGVYAVATDTSGTGGAAIQGYHTGIGDAGDFYIDNTHLTKSQTALSATNAGGGGRYGEFGNAGIFTITNQNNASTALSATGTVGDGVDGISYGDWAVSGFGYSKNGFFGSGVFGFSQDTYAAYFQTGSGDGPFCFFNGSGGWNCSADSAHEEDFHAVDEREVLRRLVDMPVFNFRMKKQGDPSERLLGPTAQDFKSAFGLGQGDTTINTGNAQGVALAAIKGLYAELQDRDARIAALEESNANFAADHDRATADRNEIAALKRALADQNAALARVQADMTRVLQNGTVREAKLSE